MPARTKIPPIERAAVRLAWLVCGSGGYELLADMMGISVGAAHKLCSPLTGAADPYATIADLYEAERKRGSAAWSLALPKALALKADRLAAFAMRFGKPESKAK